MNGKLELTFIGILILAALLSFGVVGDPVYIVKLKFYACWKVLSVDPHIEHFCVIISVPNDERDRSIVIINRINNSNIPLT